MTASGPPFRVLPRLDEMNRFFWTSGERGALSFLQCCACGRFVHPPTPLCPYCLDGDLRPQDVSGRAKVTSFTVNHQQWIPGSDPYVIGLVTIAEQQDVRLTTNIVGCDAEEVRIGMDVEVTFEHHDDVWLPLFRPASSTAGPSSSAP
jgi:uncharacterized OB-fold protein